MSKKGAMSTGFLLVIGFIALILYLRAREKPFEIATVGKVNYSRFSMEISEEWFGLTYIETTPRIHKDGRWGRTFIAPTEDYDLPWSQIKENIIAGKYRELSHQEVEDYVILVG